MFEAMKAFTDALCGEQPHDRMVGPGAEKVRANRRQMMDFLHHFAAVCMKEGAARAMNPGRQGAMVSAVDAAVAKIQRAKLN